jgi:hypothetical protein
MSFQAVHLQPELQCPGGAGARSPARLAGLMHAPSNLQYQSAI